MDDAEITRTFTPLHSASSSNDVQKAKVLIDAGVNINAQCEYGLTPLMIALCEGDGDFMGPEVARLLIESGADVSLRDKDGETVLEYVNNYFEGYIQYPDMAKTFLGASQRELIDLVRRVAARSR